MTIGFFLLFADFDGSSIARRVSRHIPVTVDGDLCSWGVGVEGK